MGLIIPGALTLAGLWALGLAAGFGLLSLLRVPAGQRERLCLAPFAATVLWVLPTSTLMRLGWPVRSLAAGLGLVTLGLAAVGVVTAWRAWRTARPGRRRSALGLAAGLAALVVWLTWPSLRAGLTAHLGLTNPDAHYFTSLAAHYWRHGRDVPASLPPFFADMAGSLAGSESGSAMLLAVLSPLVEPGEPMFVRNVFVVWTLVVLVFGLAAYRLAWRRTSERVADGGGATADTLLYVVASAGLGWALLPAVVGNWDNALLVGAGPVLAAVLLGPVFRPAHGVLFGTVVAFALTAYTEATSVLALVLAPLLVARLREPTGRGALLRAGAVAVLIAAAWLAWSVGPLVAYLGRQLALAQDRPGGRFAFGLVEMPLRPGVFWALGPEQGISPPPWVEWPLALFLTGLFLIGAIRLRRRAEGGSLLLALAATAAFVFVAGYAYGAYKVLSVTWWLVGRGLVEGFATVLRPVRDRPWARRMVLSGVAALGVAVLLHTGHLRRHFFFSAAETGELPSIATLVQLREAARVWPRWRVLIDAHTLGAEPWVRYALRDTAVDVYGLASESEEVGRPPGWSAGPVGILTTPAGRAAYPGAAVELETADLVLLRPTLVLLLAKMQNPNGGGVSDSWLGTEPIALRLWAQGETPAGLLFDAAPGPSLPATRRRTVRLTRGSTELAVVAFDRPSRLCLSFTVRPGWDTLSLGALERPTVAVMPNGDTRPLVVRVMGLVVVPGVPCA